MKKILMTLLAGASVCLLACGGGESGQQNEGSATMASGSDTTITNTHIEPLDITLLNNDSIIQATVQAGKIPDSLALKIDHPYQQIHLVIQGVTTDSLTGSLTAGGQMRNIRFNQIVMPDGKMDGPFGHEIYYKTPQKGSYMLIVGKDNMADGELQGPLTVHIQLK